MKENKVMRVKCILIVVAVISILLFAEGKLSDYLCASKDIHCETIGAEGIVEVNDCREEGRYFIPVGDDPSITLISEKYAQVNHVLVKLSEELSEETAVQVYYDEGYGFREEKSIFLQAEKGCKQFDIMLPAKNYQYLKFDINCKFSLEKVELSMKKFFNNTFKSVIFWGCAWLINVALIFILNMKLRFFEMISFREQFKLRKLRLSLWCVLCIVGLILLNSLYLGDGSYYFRNNDANNALIGNADGYYVKGSSMYFKGGSNYGIDLECPDHARSMLLYFGMQHQKDLSVKYTELDEDGKKLGDQKTVVWKKNTDSVKLSGLTKSCASIRMEIPESFQLSKIYYNSMYDNVLFLKIALAILFIVLSYGLSIILLCSACIADGVNRIWDKCALIPGYIRENYKRIIKNAAVIIATIAAAILINYVGGQIFGWRVTGKSALFFVGTILLIDTVVFLQNYFRKKIELIGFLCILTVGSIFAFIEPPYLGMSWDDETHYSSALRLSHCMDHQISESDNKLLADFTINAYSKIYYTEDNQLSYSVLLDQLEKADFYSEDRGSAFSPGNLVYLPSAIGLVLGRGIGLPFHLTVIFGKWMNVLFLAVLCYFAMRRLKNGKIVVLLVALVPTNIFIAANYTYDTWLTGWSILGISLFMGELQEREKKITVKSMIAIAGSMCLAVMPKMVYFPLTLLVLFMPKYKFKSRRQQYGYYAMIIGAMLLPFLLLYFSTFGSSGGVSSVEDLRGGSEVNANDQIDYIISNFGAFMQTIYRFLCDYLNPLKSGSNYLTDLAYVADPTEVLSYVILCTIIAGGIFHHEDDARLPWWYRAGTLCVYVGVGIICSVSMYIMYTAVGAKEVAGVQGRYLLPVIFPAVYVLTRIPLQTKVKGYMEERGLTKVVDMILVGIMIFSGIIAVWNGFIMRY